LLIAYVPSVQEILEFRVYLQPSVRVSISFMANAIRLLAGGSIHDRSSDSDALLFHDKA